MLLFIVFAPLITALLILIGAPARLTALLGSGATVIAALAAFFLYDPAPSRISVRQFVSDQRNVAASVLVRRRWAQPDHAFSCRPRLALRRLVHPADPEIGASLLRLSALRRERGNRRVRFARSLFLLRVSRACLDSDFSSHRYLGLGQPVRGGLESDYLSRTRQLRFAPRADPALSQRAARPAQF